MEGSRVKNIIVIAACLVLGVVFVVASFMVLNFKKEDHTNIEEYSSNLTKLIESQDVRSGLKIFPTEVNKDKVKEFKYYSEDDLFVGSYLYYLVVDYDKDEFNAEVERIKSVNQPFRDIVKNIFFAKTGFKYPAYITIWDGNGTYEYALVDEENTTIAYVLNQLFDWKDTDIAEEYLPKDYSVPSTSKDTGKDGYSMYYVYDEFGTGYRFDELH
ncbi:MAG: hypothetical protein IKD74_05160 [Clostridia bacterium]|nr:hypothetical protein [Clostridia bacterium]